MADVEIADLDAGTVGTTIVGTSEVEIQTSSDSYRASLNQANLAANVPCCEVSRTADQTIGHGSPVAIQFNAADGYDTDTMHDPSSNNTHIVATTAGVYHFVATLSWAAGEGTTGIRIGYFRKNGSGDPIPHQSQAANNTANDICVSMHMKLAAGEYVEVMAYQDSGSDKTMNQAICHAARIAIG